MITYDELIAMCEASIDVAVDRSSHELDLVLERLRSLGSVGRAKLRLAIFKAIEDAATDVREATRELQNSEQDVERWRKLRDEAMAKAPGLVAELDAKIADIEAHQDLELREYQATLEALQRALALVDKA